MSEKVTSLGAVISLTLTLQSAPSLAEAWSAMQLTRARFLKKGWLTSHSLAWHRQTEITFSPTQGWHVHDHWLLHPAPSAQSLCEGLVDRWLRCAAFEGVEARREAQRAVEHASGRDSLRYVTKGVMTPGYHGDGLTPGDLLAHYMAGDAEAAEAWRELERHFSVRRVSRASGGEFRAKRSA